MTVERGIFVCCCMALGWEGEEMQSVRNGAGEEK